MAAPAPVQHERLDDTEMWLHMVFLIMTFVTGLIDASSYLGLGRVFTANMTGNVVLLGFAAARVPGLSLIRPMVALGCALIGGVVAGRLKGALQLRNRRRWLTVSGATEVLLLLAAFVVAFHWGSRLSLESGVVIAIIALTGCSMGVRNATVRSMGVQDITTTVLTLTVAALSSESALGGGSNPRWGRRVGAIVSMLMGAYAGALLLHVSLAAVLGVATLLTCATTIFQFACLRKQVEDSLADALKNASPFREQ